LKLSIILLFLCYSLHAQWRIEGKVEDFIGVSGLEHATVQFSGPRSAFAVTDSVGRFVLEGLSSGTYLLEVRHILCRPWRDSIRVAGNMAITIRMQPAEQELQEVTISQSRRRIQPANVRLSREDVARRASMLGEANIYDALQQQAGIIHTSELNPGLYVRGMSAGHTGIYIEGMSTLAGNHLLGIYPPFNADAFSGIRLIKEDIHAQYGGYLASYLMMETSDAIHEHLSGSVEVGVLTSKLSLEIPLAPNKAAWTANIRRSYFDLIANSYNHINRNNSEYLPLPTYGFYDVNNSLQMRTGKRSLLKVATLFSGDRFDMEGRFIEMSGKWNNQLAVANWSRYFSDRLRGQLHAGINNYRAVMTYHEATQKKMTNRVLETMLQGSISWDILSGWLLNAGMFVRRHDLLVRSVSTLNDFVAGYHRLDKTVFDWGGYADISLSPGDIFRFKTGVRIDRYCSDTRSLHLSPMASVSASVAGGTALLSARRNVQFAKLYVPLGVQLPVNIWYPSDSMSPPETSWNISISYGRRFGAGWNANVAVYYTILDNLVELMQGNYFSSLDFSTDTGSGLSKGVETGLSYQTSQFHANVQYSLGQSTCRFSKINGGKTYPLSFDIRHKFDFTVVWHWRPRWSMSMAQFLQSGFIMTVPTGIYLHQEADVGYNREWIVPIYTDRNNFRMPLSHRMDVSVKHDFIIKSLDASWTAGLYNAYACQNPYHVFFSREENADGQIFLQLRTKSLMPLVPFISLKVNF